jgi:KDO2-lipid IV(A) lauroyltransferase
MRRVRRSRYEVEFKLLWDGKEALEPNQITEKYARSCEADVLRSPADWLWSYRRWKLKKPLVRRRLRLSCCAIIHGERIA